MASKKPRIVQLPLNSDPATAKALKALSKRTRKSQQAYLREGLALVLQKYSNTVNPAHQETTNMATKSKKAKSTTTPKADRKSSSRALPVVDFADEKKPTAEKPKAARPPGVKAQVAALLQSGDAFTLEELLRRTSAKEVTLKTAISDLRSPKYCGSTGVLNIVSVEGKYRLGRAEES